MLRLGVVLLLASAVAVNGAFCHGKPDPNAQPTDIPINEVQPTTPVRTTKNGKAFVAGTAGNEMWILHLYGTPYEMGYAHGSLMKDEAFEMATRVWAYLESQVTEQLGGLPNWLKDDIAEFGLDVALDLTYELTKNYTGTYFYEELQGLADASGADYQMLVRIHLIGELTKGDCSMYGAWGKATASTGKTFQLRALDWDIDGPFKDYPAVVVYHPSSGNGHAFANLGFVGWIGALSGQSSTNMAISEIGVAFPDATFGKESREGTPFTYLLRDILQFDNSYEDSIKRITDAHRTCDLILGVGDGKAKTFRGFEYSASVANVISDTNLQPVNSTWHAPIENIVYWGMDWLCPGYNSVLHDRLEHYYGNITAETTIHGILPVVQTGNVHIAVYDLTDQLMYVSVAMRSNGTGLPNAYQRQFTMLDLKKLWAEPAPSPSLSLM